MHSIHEKIGQLVSSSKVFELTWIDPKALNKIRHFGRLSNFIKLANKAKVKPRINNLGVNTSLKIYTSSSLILQGKILTVKLYYVINIVCTIFTPLFFIFFSAQIDVR